MASPAAMDSLILRTPASKASRLTVEVKDGRSQEWRLGEGQAGAALQSVAKIINTSDGIGVGSINIAVQGYQWNDPDAVADVIEDQDVSASMKTASGRPSESLPGDGSFSNFPAAS